MFRARTVFVLGAGASAEVGMPMGDGLLKSIVDLLDVNFEFHSQNRGDIMLVRALRNHLEVDGNVDETNFHLRAGWQIRESSQQALSIDNVIDALEDKRVELIGKLAIARAIIMAEGESSFFKEAPSFPEHLTLSKFDQTWYSSLSKILMENIRKSQVDGLFENLEIINFNYDRCLEHYLPFSISRYYGISLEEARSLMSGLTVHRPYGVVGKLPWQPGDLIKVPFGQASVETLVASAQQVRTFTEQVEEGTHLLAIRQALANAERIVFLGFAFHRQNVDLLGVRALQDGPEVLATAYQVSRADQAVIKEEVYRAFELDGPLPSEAVTLADLKCSDFCREYWRTLTAEGPFQPRMH